MIRCAVHHTDTALCGCDPDEQYREAQARAAISALHGEEMREKIARILTRAVVDTQERGFSDTRNALYVGQVMALIGGGGE